MSDTWDENDLVDTESFYDIQSSDKDGVDYDQQLESDLCADLREYLERHTFKDFLELVLEVL